MKRLIALCSILSLFTILSTGIMQPHVLAVDVLNQACSNVNATQEPTVCKDNHPSGPNPFFGPDGVVTKGIQIFALVIGVTAVIVIIISGIKFMTTMGDSNSVATARQAIIYALVGLVIASLAQVIVTFVLTKV